MTPRTLSLAVAAPQRVARNIMSSLCRTGCPLAGHMPVFMSVMCYSRCLCLWLLCVIRHYWRGPTWLIFPTWLIYCGSGKKLSTLECMRKVRFQPFFQITTSSESLFRQLYSSILTAKFKSRCHFKVVHKGAKTVFNMLLTSFVTNVINVCVYPRVPFKSLELIVHNIFFFSNLIFSLF